MLHALPFELIELIISFIPFYDLFDLSLTNVFFFHLISRKHKLTNIQKKLHPATRLGKLSIIRFASLAYPTQFSKTIQRDPWPLNFSIEYNNPHIISFLLSHNAKVSVYALNLACLYEDLNLVKTLPLL